MKIGTVVEQLCETDSKIAKAVPTQKINEALSELKENSIGAEHLGNMMSHIRKKIKELEANKYRSVDDSSSLIRLIKVERGLVDYLGLKEPVGLG